MPDGIEKLLSHLEISRLARLAVGSRYAVEGTLQGAHRSPQKGFSIEFSDYRPYVPGDDLRHLDWRVFARKERLYIRQYEEESNLRVYLLVDGSSSMRYGYGEASKYFFAAKLAAALAYVTVQQQDSVGLQLYDSKVRRQLPARSSREHLRVLANMLAEYEPGEESDLDKSLQAVAERAGRRALIILISDLYDDTERLRRALARLRRRRHDVVVYQVMDRAEIDFPFRDVGNFEDLETGQRIVTNPGDIRRAYQEAVAEFLEQCRHVCRGLDVEYVLSTTDHDVPSFVRSHLARRQRYSH